MEGFDLFLGARVLDSTTLSWLFPSSLDVASVSLTAVVVVNVVSLTFVVVTGVTRVGSVVTAGDSNGSADDGSTGKLDTGAAGATIGNNEAKGESPYKVAGGIALMEGGTRAGRAGGGGGTSVVGSKRSAVKAGGGGGTNEVTGKRGFDGAMIEVRSTPSGITFS